MIATLAAAPTVIVGVLEDDGEEETGGTTGPTGGTTGPTGVAVERKTSELCESGEAPIALMARIAIL